MTDIRSASFAAKKPARPAPERESLFAFSTNYLKQDGPEPGMLVHRGFHAMYVPRLILACRLLGHAPVVDGTEGTPNRPGYRWVCCDRCGLRCDPEYRLDPSQWNIGDTLDGNAPPCAWPRATGGLSAEIVVDKNIPGASISFAVDSAGDENTLAAHVRLSPLGAVYVHTEQFGNWFQRRLNPTGYDARVIEIGVGDGRLWWRVWAKRGEHSRATPRWRDGSVVVDPRDRLLGELRYSYEPVGEPVAAVVRMPEGDDHEVTLNLRRVRRGRKHGDGKLSWSAEWSSDKGIPFRRNSWKGDEVMASAVEVSDAAVKQGRWAEEACAAIAVSVSAMRTRYRWRAASQAMADDCPEGED